MINTSWQNSADWYQKKQGLSGDYYHDRIVIPQSLKLLDLKPTDSLLDLACGQGVLARAIPPSVNYYGIDSSPSLISFAKKQSRNDKHHFSIANVTKEIKLSASSFTHACLMLAIQNLEKPEIAIKNAADNLKPKGKLLIVMNHPCFRIPRQTSWEIDPKTNSQYRRINRYLSPLSVPIAMNPGEKKGRFTWSFHLSLSDYSRMLSDNGFCITLLEEWVSDKKSVGKAAKMENSSRREFPLFLALLCQKER